MYNINVNNKTNGYDYNNDLSPLLGRNDKGFVQQVQLYLQSGVQILQKIIAFSFGFWFKNLYNTNTRNNKLNNKQLQL